MVGGGVRSISPALPLADRRGGLREVGWTPVQTDTLGELPNREILMAQVASSSVESPPPGRFRGPGQPSRAGVRGGDRDPVPGAPGRSG